MRPKKPQLEQRLDRLLADPTLEEPANELEAELLETIKAQANAGGEYGGVHKVDDKTDSEWSRLF